MGLESSYSGFEVFEEYLKARFNRFTVLSHSDSNTSSLLRVFILSAGVPRERWKI